MRNQQHPVHLNEIERDELEIIARTGQQKARIMRHILRKLEFHFTPKHGSWLNMAEIELAILSRQCLKQRLADQSLLQHVSEAWSKQRNQQESKINWCFNLEKARTTLAHLYPGNHADEVITSEVL